MKLKMFDHGKYWYVNDVMIGDRRADKTQNKFWVFEVENICSCQKITTIKKGSDSCIFFNREL